MKKTTALIVAPHHDDEVIGCGGTMQILAEAGSNIQVCYVYKGISGFKINSANKTIRKDEAQRSSEVLNYDIVGCLDIKDRTYGSMNDIVKGLVAVFRAVKPDIIFAPHENEKDSEHRIVSQACWEARWLSATNNFETLGARTSLKNLMLFYEIWTPLSHVSLFTDITPYVSLKQKALRRFATQMESQAWVEGITGLNAYRGVTIVGRGLCEAFDLKEAGLDSMVRILSMLEKKKVCQ